MTDQIRVVFGGVDTHKQTHVAAVVDDVGRVLATESFAVNAVGYRRLVVWMRTFGEVARVGVEGTGSYGADLARHLAMAAVEVVEVNRPNRQVRRRRGKSDTVDAEAAARAALNGEAAAVPKSRDGIVEAIRALRVVFASTRASRTRVSNRMRDLIFTAPEQVRRDLEPLDAAARAAKAARFRPGALTDPTEATRAALRMLGRQFEAMTADMDELRDQLDELTLKANPALRAAKGVGADVASILLVVAGDNAQRLNSEASFAALCGASPVEASSGRVVRHRLNQGGNRQGNHALWRIAFVRLTSDANTKAYVAKRRAEGKTSTEIMRCLKRYIAREIYALLVNPQPVIANGAQLRAARIAAGLTQQDIAVALGADKAQVSRVENNRGGNYAFTDRYRAWLQQNSGCAA